MPDPRPAGEPGDALAHVVRAVLRADPGRDALGIAELLWLAGLGAPPPPAPAGGEPASTDVPTPTARPAVVRAADEAAPPVADPGTGAEEPGREDEEVPERPVAVPGRQRLLRERDLLRALYPLRQPWPHGRLRQLDVGSTVAEYGRTGELSPVFSPAPERWFDLTLVVDSSTSMSVWQETAGELVRLLGSLNAFRTVRILTIDADLPAPGLHVSARRPANGAALSGPARPGRRGLVLVFSDCTARAWRSGHLWGRLHRWARGNVTALVNPLPVRVWRHVGVELAAVRVTSAGMPGAPNGGLIFRAPPGTRGLPVPTVTLSAPSLARWTRTLMRCGPAGCDALLVPASGGGQAVERWGPADAGGGDAQGDEGALAKAFQDRASVAAVRLAVLCSPFPEFGIPLLRLIAEDLVPEATESDLAEFLVGGPVVPGKRVPAGDDESAWVRYRPAVREHFISLLSTREAWRLYDALTRAVARGPVRRTGPRGAGGLPGGGAWAALAGGSSLAEAPAQVLRLLRIALAQEPAEEPVEEQAQQQTEEPVGRQAEEPVEEQAQQQTEEPVEEQAEQTDGIGGAGGPAGADDEDTAEPGQGGGATAAPAGERVVLWPGQTLRLPRAGNGAVEVLRVETSWIGQRPRGLLRRFREPSDLDLDASAVCFSQGQPVDVVFFRHLVSDDGSIRHSGDSLTTPGPTSESITVDLARVPVHVDAVVFTLNSFTGLTFAEVRTVTLRLFDDTAGRELAACALPANGTSTAYVLAKLSRLGTDWQVTALQVPANGRTFQDLMPAIIPLL